MIRREFLVARVGSVAATLLNAQPHAQFSHGAAQACLGVYLSVSRVHCIRADGDETYRVNVQKIFEVAKHANYRGYFSMEFDRAGDPYEGTKKLLAQSLQYLS